jgi:hypothetical protein
MRQLQRNDLKNQIIKKKTNSILGRKGIAIDLAMIKVLSSMANFHNFLVTAKKARKISNGIKMSILTIGTHLKAQLNYHNHLKRTGLNKPRTLAISAIFVMVLS